MEVDLITAAGDGLGPAVLLSLGTRLKAQYLFSVPEGFSRVVLEHKLRPGLGLRAIFCPDLLASTGLPGLLMRLRGEGHGQVEIFGPSGIAAFVSSLRHFVHWKHPAVLVNEVEDPRQYNQQLENSTAPPPSSKKHQQNSGNNDAEISEDEYSDENIAIKCIWVDNGIPNSANLYKNREIEWKPPDWFFENVAATNALLFANNGNIGGRSTSSSSSSSDYDTSDCSDDSSSSEDSQSNSISTSSSDEEVDDDDKAGVGNDKKSAMFASLDAAFVKGSGGSGSSRLRTQALGLLKSSKPPATQKPRGNLTKKSGGDGGSRLLSVLASLEKTAVPSDPTRRQVGDRLYTRCEADGISLFSRENIKGNTKEHPRHRQPGEDVAPSSTLVAFLCLIKASNQVLLIVNCTAEDQIRQFHAHPAVHAMAHLPIERRAGCIIMLGSGLSHRQPAQDLFSTLQQPPQQQQPQQKHQRKHQQNQQPSILSIHSPSIFIVEHPGIGCRSSNLGYISSARMAARLHMVSQRMFPLPISLRPQVQPPPPPLPLFSRQEQQGKKEEEETNCRFYKQKLTKIVWIDGKPVIKPKVNEGEEAAKAAEKITTTATSATAVGNRDVVDVEQLQSTAHEADPELKSKLEKLTESLPLQYRNHSISFPQKVEEIGTAATAAAGVGEKRPQEIEVDAENNNKRAAAALQARLKHATNSTNTTITANTVQFKPPPPPNPPPAPPPPPPPPPPPSFPPAEEPEVIFLGTGSAEPSQHRGASAIYLNPGRGYANFLLDCGEGCYGQLVRFHGPQGAGALISNLSGIWISHRHADHMAGIVQILAHYPATAPPLLLIGPRSLYAWLSEAAPAVGLSQRYCYAHCSEVQQPHHWAYHRICSSLGLLGLSTVPVRHCSDAFGIVLRHCTGWTLVYSGDTEPSEALVRTGTGATLLIHEATFEPLLVSEARKKRHSTSVEAMDVARRMGAYRTVLTHFSQRYPKFPEGLSEAVAAGIERGEGSSVGVAFDGMCLPLGLLAYLPAVTVAVEAVLAAAALASENAKAGGVVANG